jgi:hypothetical protein
MTVLVVLLSVLALCFVLMVGWLWRVRGRPITNVDHQAAAIDRRITHLARRGRRELMSAERQDDRPDQGQPRD